MDEHASSFPPCADWLAKHAGASVVVFRALQLGDMLCAVPALRSLRQALPTAHITLVGLPWASQFVGRFSQYLDEFIAFPGHPALPEQAVQRHRVTAFYATMRARRFDLALQLHGSGEHSNAIVGGFGARAMAGFGVPPARCSTVGARARHDGRTVDAESTDDGLLAEKGPITAVALEVDAGAQSSASRETNKTCIGDGAFFMPFPQIGPESSRLRELMAGLGAPDAGGHLEFPLDRADHDELSASGLAEGLERGSYLCVHPGARWRDKCWPAARFAEVADTIAQATGLVTVLTGSANEAPLTAAVAAHMRTPCRDAAAPISIGAMAALMAGARLLICNDTGVSHIAAGLGLPSVVIFSKADIGRWAPLDRQHHRCLWDPAGEHAAVVLEHARSLLGLS